MSNFHSVMGGVAEEGERVSGWAAVDPVTKERTVWLSIALWALCGKEGERTQMGVCFCGWGRVGMHYNSEGLSVLAVVLGKHCLWAGC